ncbi:MAG: B12-binding domain-containing radical SAM protein [Myxococcales bacterium]|nr:B12-binding domain-containing radical SAM protein [Myxococcales bacterium]
MAKVLLATLFKRQKNAQMAPPLGLLYLGAVLRQARHEVRILDLRTREEPLAAHLETIARFAPDVVGLSVIINEAQVLQSAVEELKKHVPLARIVVGGPYVHGSLLHVLRIPGVDAAVRGEGEVVLPKLVAAWANDETPPDLPGVAYPGRTLGPEPEPILDLDALPYPAWDLADIALYQRRTRHGYLYKYDRYFSLSSSRGCPYECAFCLNTFGRRYRTRSPESVVGEIEALTRGYNIREIHFVDDDFNLDLDRAKRICDLIVERGLNIAITFPAGLRADRMDRELIDKLARAGCFKIPYGIETASPRLQALLKKNVNFAKLEMVIEHTAARGIITQGFFMLGFPGETEEEARQTVDYALRSKLTFITFNHLNVLPGTALWDVAERAGKTQDFDPARIDYDDPPIHLAAASPRALKRLVRRVHLRFYLNPRRLWRIWRLLPQKKHFFGFSKLFFGKLFWFKEK